MLCVVYTVHKKIAEIMDSVHIRKARRFKMTNGKPRNIYRHGDLRRALIDAGIELVREGGPDAIVLREATRRAGMVPNAAYRHFLSALR